MSHRQHLMASSSAASAIVLSVCGAAAAQQAPNAPSKPEASASTVQEVIITAEKRASTVQKTPISITAISGQDIVARGATDFDKLAQDVPGISERTSGPGQTEFEMRGLSSSGGAAPTVGFYLDETPLTAASFTQNGKVVIDPDLYDVSRVEVLRGPQGTLYGSGSMGGTIKLVTNEPNLHEFQASADVSGSGTAGADRANNSENVMVNLPLVEDKLALRLVGSDTYTAGWIDRIVVGTDNATSWAQPNPQTRWNPLSQAPSGVAHDVNSAHTQSFRATLTYQPVDNLTITPMFMYERGVQDGYNAYDSIPGTMAHYQPFNAPEGVTDSFDLGSLTVKYHASSFDITSATAYWTRSENQLQDASENLAVTLGAPAPSAPIWTRAGSASRPSTSSTPRASSARSCASPRSGIRGSTGWAAYSIRISARNSISASLRRGCRPSPRGSRTAPI